MAAQKAGKYAGIFFAGAVLTGCAVGLAASAQADNCDPFLLSMTPQPVLSCQAPDAPPPAEVPPPPAEVPPPAEPGPFGLAETPPPPVVPDEPVG